MGLQLAEAKDLLAAVQDTLVTQHVSTALSAQVACLDCGVPRRHKDSRPLVMRTLFGTLSPDSPRWWHCPCSPRAAHMFSPLAALLPERTTPELSYLQARFAGLVSYGASADLLGELLPLGRVLHATTVRQMQATAQRLEDELGDEQPSFIDGCPRDWAKLPRPDLPLIVGLDGGYVHSSTQRTRRDGWFEVIAGKVMPHQGPAACFSYEPDPATHIRMGGQILNTDPDYVLDISRPPPLSPLSTCDLMLQPRFFPVSPYTHWATAPTTTPLHAVDHQRGERLVDDL